MKTLLQFVLLAALLMGCKRQPNQRNVLFLAAGEQAIVGSYTLDSLKEGTGPICTLGVSTNYTFTISNLPVGGSSKTVSVAGSWKLTAYQVFGSQRYTVSFAGVTNIIRVGFPNADLPEGTNPTALSVWWKDQQGQPVAYLFKQIQNSSPQPPQR